MSNLAVSSIKFTSTTSTITNADGSITYLTCNSSGTIGVNGIVFPTGTQTKAVNTVADIVSTTPSTGQALVWNGTIWGPGSVAGRLLSVNVYTNQSGDATTYQTGGGSATWTRPSGCTSTLVYVTGGGGGARVNDNSYRGAGGGGGGTSIRWITNVDATVAVTWGSGGGYSRNGGRGGTGGTSSFGAYCSATGGQGGLTDSPYEGGLGGSATGGDMNIPGGGGEMAHDSNREGGGGMSFWHKAGSNHHCCGGSYVVTAGRWGSGGGYGYYSQNAFDFGNGGGGVVVVYSYS
jgi:hypothetical protein